MDAQFLKWIAARADMIDPLAGDVGEQVDELISQIHGLFADNGEVEEDGDVDLDEDGD